MLVIPSRLIATCFSLVCFAAAMVVGLAAGNGVVTVLWRALLVMGGAWLVGQVAGVAIQHTLNEHVEAYRRQHPMPGEAPAAEADEATAPASDGSGSETAPASSTGPAGARP